MRVIRHGAATIAGADHRPSASSIAPEWSQWPCDSTIALDLAEIGAETLGVTLEGEVLRAAIEQHAMLDAAARGGEQRGETVHRAA